MKPRGRKPNALRANGRSAAAPEIILQVDDEAIALDLRRAGKSYRQIAHDRVARALKRLLLDAKEPAEDVRELEIDRLDGMLARLWPRIERDDDAAYHLAMKVMDRRAALLGLDAPKRSEVTGKDGAPLLDDPREILRRKVEALAAARAPQDDPG
jgi:hypothetical protein